MTFLDPFAVDGATVHGAHLRRETFRNTKGATGVDDPTALKVIAVPGSPGVAGVMPGGGLIAIESRRETYSVMNLAMDGDALVDIPAAGSSGATHFVVVEVTDPEYHGQEPAATPRVVSSLAGLSRPVLPLARIRLSAGEGFTTTSVIEDLRRVALPRMDRRLFAWNPTSSDEATQSLTTTTAYPVGSYWPNMRHNEGFWEVDIPEWATHANMIGTWAGVRVANGTANGWLWVRIGGTVPEGAISTQGTRWSLDQSGNGRESWHAADDITIPERMRGTRQMIRLLGARLSGTGAPVIDSATSISVDVQFTEGPA